MKTARNSGSDDYVCKHAWDEDMFVQCGGDGVVIGKNPYRTAFFEAFPKKPSCFLRGEGATIEEAEQACWDKYQKVLTCDHEMERRNRTDGYGYCKHCSYSSMVFEPLTKCCKCGVPTAHSTDKDSKSYCKKHVRFIPRTKRQGFLFSGNDAGKGKPRRPRKIKKRLKNAAIVVFGRQNIFGKITFSVSVIDSVKMKCDGYQMSLLFREQERKLLKNKL